MRPSYEKGLTEVADGVLAYLQPDGGWGWSNAGLVVGEGSSTLIDTLFDLKLTAEMLTEMSPLTRSCPIAAVVNTHANGDHCFGNGLVAAPGVEIVASAAAAAEMEEISPATLAALMTATKDQTGNLADFARHAFGPFDFEGIALTPPTRTFSGRHRMTVGDRTVELIEVGPAHTTGDVIAWLADERVVFTGDILFVGGTPIMWAGPVDNWIAACDRIIDLQPAAIVPGHGPLTDAEGVATVRGYLAYLAGETAARHQAGMTAPEAVRDLSREIANTPYGDWPEGERLVVNVESIWASLEPGYRRPDTLTLMSRMADLAAELR
jgi:glyoxylase-like metal-dependent hydrolase (beta-lactamase superfamily II)